MNDRYRTVFGALARLTVLAGLSMLAACTSSGTSTTPTEPAAATAVSTPTTVAASTAAPVTEAASTEALPSTAAPTTSIVATTAASTTAAFSTAAPSGANAVDANGRPLTMEAAFALDRPLILAHAGGDLEAPHSTMFAFKRAVALGVDVLEMDVQLSGDGVLVVHHDDTVDRTANGTGTVSSMTVAELQALDNAHWFVPGCWSCPERAAAEAPFRGVRTGAKAPPADYTAEDFTIVTLEQVIQQFPDMLLDIEIKGDGLEDRATAEALAARIAGTPDERRVVVASFSDELLTVFRAAAPNVPTSPGLGSATEFVLNDVPIPDRVLQVPPTFNGLEVVNDALIAKLDAAGIELWVWPESSETDDAAVYQAMIDLGADGVIAGRPKVMYDLVFEEG